MDEKSLKAQYDLHLNQMEEKLAFNTTFPYTTLRIDFATSPSSGVVNSEPSASATAYSLKGTIDLKPFFRLMNAIGIQESNNRYSLLGPLIVKGSYAGQRAVGKYQFMDDEIARISKRLYKRLVSETEFLHNPDLQDEMFAELIREKVRKYGGNISEMILDHYGGYGAVLNYRRQSPGFFSRHPIRGGSAPSHKQYLESVLSLMAKQSDIWPQRKR